MDKITEGQWITFWVGIIVLAAYFMLRYLDGAYSFNETEYLKKRYWVTKRNLLGKVSQYEVERITFKRVYVNNTVKYRTIEIKI